MMTLYHGRVRTQLNKNKQINKSITQQSKLSACW